MRVFIDLACCRRSCCCICRLAKARVLQVHDPRDIVVQKGAHP